MNDRMKFFDHEGIHYVVLFQDAENRVIYQETNEPIVLTVDEAIDLCSVTGLNGKGVMLHLSIPPALGGGVTTVVFSWATPNLGQAMLRRVGAIDLLRSYYFKKKHPNL